MGFLITQTGGGSLTYKDAVRTASSANVPLTGSAPIIVGGVSLNDKDRVLLKNQGTASQNGIYTIAISGGTYTLTRSTDCNTSKEMVPNMLVPVSEGTSADQYFQLTTNAPIILGTTALVFDYAAVYDHGLLIGLGDDDHTQYLNTTRAKTWFDTDYLKQTVTNGSTATVPSEDAVFDHVASATSNLANRSLSNLTSPTALNQVLLGQDGTATAPAFSFTADTNTGMYRSAADTINFSTNGVNRIAITDNETRISNTVHANVYKALGGLGTPIQFEANAAHMWFGVAAFSRSIDGGTGFETAEPTTADDFGKRLSLVRLGYNNGGVSRFTSLQLLYKLGINNEIPASGVRTINPGTFFVRGARSYNRGGDTIYQFSTLSTGTTLTINYGGQVGASNIGWTVGAGDFIESSGSPGVRAKVLSVTSASGNNSVVVVDQSLNPGNITIFQDVAIFRKWDNTELLNISYDGLITSHANLKLNSGLNIKSRHAQTGTVTALTSDIYIGCDSSGGAVTVNLPTASSSGAGKKLIIKDEGGNATTNNISIVGNGSDVIDGSGTQALVVNYESVTLVCDGVSKWFII